MNIILLGPQGSGKGTQAALLNARIGVVQVASGDVLRAAIQSASPLGLKAKSYYDVGELVPDEIVIGLLIEAIDQVPAGTDVLLDGFPRTVAQARALDAALAERGSAIDKVIELRLPLDVAKERLSGRLVCRTCGAVYNERTRPPRVPGVCDIDGGPLCQRADDYPEAIEKRLKIWERENDALVGYYESRGILERVDAQRSPEDVSSDLLAIFTASDASA